MSMLNSYWRRVLVIVPIIGALTATVFFLLRLYSRRRQIKHLDSGDLLMSLGLLFSYAVTISTILGGYIPRTLCTLG